MKIKQIDPRIERNRIILELYDYIENNSTLRAPVVCATLYKNLNKKVKSRKDFIEYFSCNPVLIVGIGDKSLKVIREFFGITEVKHQATINHVNMSTKDAIDASIESELAFVREMGGMSNKPAGRNPQLVTDDVKAGVLSMFGVKESK